MNPIRSHVYAYLLAVNLVGVLVVAALLLSAGRGETASAAAAAETAPTLIIDAGHGGADGGAVSVTGTPESRINLAVARRLRLLCALYGLPAEMTRTGEEIDYPAGADTIHEKKVWDTMRRVEMTETTARPVLLSIHQNKFTSASSAGVQVLYAPAGGSAELAGALQARFTEGLPGTRIRETAQIQETIFLMNHIACPGVLVECGFLSNPGEAALLETEEYQRKLAAVLLAGYLDYYPAAQNFYGGGCYESENDFLLH